MNTEYWNDINEAIFEKLDTALPEFEFKQTANGWQSANVTKLDGREGKTKGQVICNIIGLLADHSESKYISYWAYIQQRDNLDNAQTAAKLRQLAGIEQRPLTAAELKEYKQQAKAAEVWELFIAYTKAYLLNCPTPDSDQYKRMKEYLTKDRKYSWNDVTAMELGMLDDWHKVTEYIKQNSTHTTDDINEVIQCSRDIIGHSHQLIIPIRNRTGKAQGIAARNINWTTTDKLPKYLYNKGANKGATVHGLPHRVKNGRAIIVEGQLDAAIIKARGYDGGSVGALGGKAITAQQADCLLKSKATELIICLDNEAATIPEVQRAIQFIRQQDEGGQIADRIYIAQLPEGVKDIDELLTRYEDGLQQFTAAIESAEVCHKWQAQQVIDQFNNSAKADIDNIKLVEGIVDIASKVNNPAHRGELLENFRILANNGGLPVTQDTLEDAALRIRERDDEVKQGKELNKLLKNATNVLNDDGPAASIKQIQDKLRTIAQRSRRTEFEQLYSNTLTEDAMKKRCQNKPLGAKLGYKMQVEGNTEELEAPAGQLTFIAARTGHGKTKVMLNVALNVLQEPERSVHFFTYEIDDIGVMQFALNIYIGEQLSQNNRRSIKAYFNQGTSQYFSKQKVFEQKKNEFFAEYINTGRLKIYHTEYSADELIQYIEEIQRKDKNAVIIIDYIQKLRSDRKGNTDHRFTELKFICEDFNSCAIRTQLPIVMAAQFNRDVQSPLDMDATKLAEASDIEKIASEIYGVWDLNQYILVDTNRKKQIKNKYNLEQYGEYRENKIILEVLKSRLYGPGHHTTLHNDWNTGQITHEPLTDQPQTRSKLISNEFTV